VSFLSEDTGTNTYIEYGFYHTISDLYTVVTIFLALILLDLFRKIFLPSNYLRSDE
jgi:hypothetical protein